VNTRRIPRALAALATIALIGAGCGGGSGENGNTGTGTGTATGGDQRPADQEKGVKFAECIRGNGVSDFPDPDPSGDFDYGVSVTPAVWKQAVDACKDLQPPGTLSADRTPEEQDASLRFARCMREHGVEDFPDPVDGEPLINTYKIPSSSEPGGMDILDAAVQECRRSLDDAIDGQP
jgi:hypothetical protein